MKSQAQYSGGTRKKLTAFGDSRHYVDLVWSPNGKKLAAVMLNEIHIIDVELGHAERLKIPQSEISGVSFNSSTSIVYSVMVNQQWQVFAYDLLTQQVIPQDKKWQFVNHQANPSNTLWLDQQEQLFVGANQIRINAPNNLSRQMISGRHFNLKKRGEHYYWFERKHEGKILQWSAKSQSTITLLNTNEAHFDVSNEHLLFSRAHQVNTDIYQTQPLPIHYNTLQINLQTASNHTNKRDCLPLIQFV